MDNIDRRHDRRAEDGWNWGGAIDLNDGFSQYDREQILSSTHFRLYQAIGGGNTVHAQVRRDAATYTAYLILRAILSLSEAVSPKDATEWKQSLITANREDWVAKGYSGGAYDKVIHWAFEKQGLFGGDPPATDVYIDDGRNGEYDYQNNLGACPAIWNRHARDGQASHQAPIANVVNYAYAKIKTAAAKPQPPLRVSAYRNRSQTSRTWPADWTAMNTPELRRRCAAAIRGRESRAFRMDPIDGRQLRPDGGDGRRRSEQPPEIHRKTIAD